MSLRDEIKADIESGELCDLFADVTWNGTALTAMVGPEATVESMDSLGGPMLSGERVFKFRRNDLLALDSDLKTIGGIIRYAGRTYDVTEPVERTGHPLVILRAELRP